MNSSKVIIVIFSLFMLSPFIGKAQIYFGGGLAYNANNAQNALGAMAKVGVGISEDFDINGNATYYFRKNTPWSLDFDLHYKLLNLGEKFLIRPFAGINVTGSNTSFALGTSLKVPTDGLTFYLEPRYIFDGKQWVISAGIIF